MPQRRSCLHFHAACDAAEGARVPDLRAQARPRGAARGALRAVGAIPPAPGAYLLLLGDGIVGAARGRRTAWLGGPRLPSE